MWKSSVSASTQRMRGAAKMMESIITKTTIAHSRKRQSSSFAKKSDMPTPGTEKRRSPTGKRVMLLVTRPARVMACSRMSETRGSLSSCLSAVGLELPRNSCIEKATIVSVESSGPIHAANIGCSSSSLPSQLEAVKWLSSSASLLVFSLPGVE